MKGNSLIAAAACLLATTAFAEENVTMYGILDVGLETLSNQADGGRSTFMAGGGSAMPSLWGFRGKEDLGNGLSASFNLEGGLDASQGTIGNSNGGIFGRQAHVGLSGGWGALKFGLQLDPAFISAVQTDPRGGAQSFSILPFWIGTNVVAGEGSKKSAANIFESSAITYAYSAAGFSGTVLYTLGGGPGAANRIVSTGLSYQGGPVFITGGAYRNKTSTGAAGPSAWNLGASYAATESLSIKGTHLDVKGQDAAAAHFVTTGVGASYAMGPVSYNVAYYLSKDKTHGGDAKLLTFGLEYSMSKRTALYAQAVSANQSSTGYNGAGLLDVNGGSFTAGKSVSGVTLGVRHLF